jgi:hypothetical protein
VLELSTAPGVSPACIAIWRAMIATLFGILDNRYPTEDAGGYYARTLRLFIFGICITFVGVFVDLSITLTISGS